MTKRALMWSVSILAALLVGVIIVGLVIIGTLNRQADDAAYRACMERLDPGYQAGTGIEDYAEKLGSNAAFCER